MWFFWTWRAEFLRWDLVGTIAPLVIAGTLALTLGRGNRRWALGCTAAAGLMMTHVFEFWARTSNFGGYFHFPSLKSFALFVAIAAACVSAGLAVAIVVRFDPPLLRIDTPFVQRAIVLGAALTASHVVSLQWVSPPANFLSIYVVGFHTGVPVAVTVILLLIASLYAVMLVAASTCGPQAAAAVSLVIAVSWSAFLAEGLTGLGDADWGRVAPGVGFVLALGCFAALATFVFAAVRAARVEGDDVSANEYGSFPIVAAVRASVVTVALYLLLLMPFHVLTTGYRAGGSDCATPIDAALNRDALYEERTIGGHVDPITNGWVGGRTVRDKVRGPCQDAARGRLFVGGAGLVLIGSGLVGAWILAPVGVRKIKDWIKEPSQTTA